MKNYTSREMKRFNHLLGELDGAYHEIALKLGLSDSAMGILYTICDRGDSCLLQDISICLGVSKQTINSAVRKLEADGIVYLEQVDGKHKRVCLTDQGKLLADRTAVRVIRAENDILASWPRDDVDKYLELTERFLIQLREKSKGMRAENENTII